MDGVLGAEVERRFRLGHVALAQVEEHEAEPSVQDERGRPVWGKLRVGQAVVKRYRQPAENQELVLQAFQEEDWPPRIDDPLPPAAEQDPKRRLHTTISNSNCGQRGIRVHFAGGGDGQSVCWRLLGAEVTGEGGAKAERV